MTQPAKRAARPLWWLGALLAVYLCAPFFASIPQIGQADWAGVDWHTMGSAVGVSVASASVAALVILVGGVPLGYWLARSRARGVAVLGFVVQLPLALPPLTSGILLLFLIGPYSAIGQFFDGALTDSFTGIVLAETFVAAPFLIVAARSAFAAVDPVYDDVAATLGHRAASRFFRVTLPIAWPAIRAGLALAWLRAFGEFGATVMVAYHPYSLPVYTYVVFGGQGLPAMMPLLLPTLGIAIVCAVLSVYSRGARVTLAVSTDNSDELTALTPVAAANTGTNNATSGWVSSGANNRANQSTHSGTHTGTHTGTNIGTSIGTNIGAEAGDARLAFAAQRRLGTFTLDVAWQPRTRRLAIIGPSGSGKSLALRIVAGLERNDAGFVSLGATDIGALPPERRQIGYMPQDYGLFPHMTVAQQLAFPVDADAASARYWLAHLGLDTLTQRLPRQLSFGQRQRVALARALTRHSQMLLFDEPFAALDTPRRRRLQQTLRALQREISAVTVIVTHDPDEAALLADEVLVIEHGRTLQAGPVDEVFARPASLRVAQLLGLHNIGVGVVLDSSEIETAGGLRLPCRRDYADAPLATGTHVMWRVSPRALRATSGGPLEGRLSGISLRHGDRYVTVEMAGETFDIPADDAAFPHAGMHASALHFEIDPAGVSAWPAAHS